MNVGMGDAAGRPRPFGLYDPVFEHDGCGVGFLARLDGAPRHSTVREALQILIHLEHRGAVGGDKSTGDGAGIMIPLPDAFFREACPRFRLPEVGQYAVAQVFLPVDSKLEYRCQRAFEHIVGREGCEVLGWRQVPVSDGMLGRLARSSEPHIRQLFLLPGKVRMEDFERKLYVIRRMVEKEISSWQEVDTSAFYVCSLSSRTMVYKGLLTGTQLSIFYPDLAEPGLMSSFAVVHQRYSTNTLPTWHLAQPLRLLAHNGEINTLGGNMVRMQARQALLKSPVLGEDLEKVLPVVIPGGSDSAVFDNVLELLVMAGRSLPHAMMMMVPEACGPRIPMSEDKRAFYEYHASLMEPWDGPAAMVFSDGRRIGATLDRNGLRPARYSLTRDGLVILASETGVRECPGDAILRHGRLQPGKMFLVDLEQNRIVPDNEIKAKISRQRPYRRWIKDNHVELRGLFMPSQVPQADPIDRLHMWHTFGYSDEELKMIISPMASRGQEAVGSMGNDASLAILSDRPQLLFSYFKQLFAQVTNPPIDPLREELVMSLESFIGRQTNLLDEVPRNNYGLKQPHPILSIDDMARIRAARHEDIHVGELDILFSADSGGAGLELSLENLFRRAEEQIDQGSNLLILTDRHISETKAPIPSLLAVAGLHHHLIRQGKRNLAGLIVETGEAREVIHFSLLVGFGADAICPYLAFLTVRELAESGDLERSRKPEEAMDAYITAIKKGLLKTFSRMGISTLHSFFASQTFEAVGIDKDICRRYFGGVVSRLGGITLEEIAAETMARHRKGFPANGKPSKLLDTGGVYHLRKDGESHLWTTEAIAKLQAAVRLNDYSTFKEFSHLVDGQSRLHCTLRSLFQFKERKSIPLEEVEPVEHIVRRFVTAAMSFGSISQEAHETIAIAMNRLGGRSNSGEGGEDPARAVPLPNGDWMKSKIRQVASGRFGVTTEYLIHAEELQIKMAQGAKPGEGGQLPGHKVTVEIARVRHTTPGVTLISPPPHHDIYSIEDLAQLIYDLKAVNPKVDVSVKLVAEVGVGTIASGVAKAKADLVLISGHDGGTGASPLTAIKHTGLPWELGLAETQQTLIRNRLRDHIRVQTDGQLKTGRDLVIAALLGAEEYGFGTAILISLGCVMMRKCHLNTCPVGVATQDPQLRSYFMGKPEHVQRYLCFVAQEMREYMAQLGFSTVDNMVGQVQVLDTRTATDHWKARHLDLTPILSVADLPDGSALRCTGPPVKMEQDCLDTDLIRLAKQALEKGQPVELQLPVRNVHRTIGAALSGMIVRRYGSPGLPEDTIKICLEGSAGQSLGAFLAPGVTLRVRGDTNDYLGKGLSGGKIILAPPLGATFSPHENVIAGNVALYGATSGKVFINGMAGERFAVRNSGAFAVVEGIGDHGCEYMTGGVVVIIGATGTNFAAGMSGGVAYVYDESQMFDTRCNLDMVDLEPVWNKADIDQLHALLQEHCRMTGSPRAAMLLDNWEAHYPLFVKVMPIDYRQSLERMRLEEDTRNDTVAATEEVYRG